MVRGRVPRMYALLYALLSVLRRAKCCEESGVVGLRQPWRCLWRRLSQMTMTRPWRRITLHLSQIFLTLGFTFTAVPTPFTCSGRRCVRG